jgi:hypothetical protein
MAHLGRCSADFDVVERPNKSQVNRPITRNSLERNQLQQDEVKICKQSDISEGFGVNL